MFLKRTEARKQLRESFDTVSTRDPNGPRTSRGAMFRRAWAEVCRPTPTDGPNRAARRRLASYHRRGRKTPEELYQEALDKLKLVSV